MKEGDEVLRDNYGQKELNKQMLIKIDHQRYSVMSVSAIDW